MPGEGSVFKLASGKWAAQLSVGGRVNRRYIRRTAATRVTAVALLDELKAERRAGVRPRRISTGDYLEQWVAAVRNIRPSTRHGYEAVIRYHLMRTVGGIPLASLTPMHVETALAKLQHDMSPKSLRNVHAVLRRALHQAVRAGLVARNVASREFVDAPRVSTVEPRALGEDEVQRLLEAARGEWLESLIIVAVGTGLRQGELLGLAWEDVEFEAGRLHVRRELVRVDGVYQRGELKTERSRREVPLAEPVLAALHRQREFVTEAGYVPTATGPVFVTRRGYPLNGSWVTHRFYRMCETAGIPRLPFKNLRTTFGSRLFEGGIPDRLIADLLGHTRTATTQGHYIRTLGANQDAALRVVEGFVR